MSASCSQLDAPVLRLCDVQRVRRRWQSSGVCAIGRFVFSPTQRRTGAAGVRHGPWHKQEARQNVFHSASNGTKKQR